MNYLIDVLMWLSWMCLYGAVLFAGLAVVSFVLAVLSFLGVVR